MNYGTKRTAHARAYITEHWQTLADRELAAALNMTINNLRHMRRRMGLVRDKENIALQHAKQFNKTGWARAYKPRQLKG